MVKIIKSDLVVSLVVMGSWLYYLSFEGATRFDVNQTITLPLFIAVWLTALAILYVSGRYFSAKKSRQTSAMLSRVVVEQQVEQTAKKSESENCGS